MLKVAITGNIAAGKSEVETILKNMGFSVYDADKISHKILENSVRVRDAFKNYDILTGDRIDRNKLAAVVFNNKEKLLLLESIIHPLVKEEILKIFASGKDLLFISVPQLFEAGFEKLFDKIILVTADKNLRRERLIKRNNLTLEEANKRLDAQIPDEDKISKSNYIITNNGSFDYLTEQVIRICNCL